MLSNKYNIIEYMNICILCLQKSYNFVSYQYIFFKEFREVDLMVYGKFINVELEDKKFGFRF